MGGRASSPLPGAGAAPPAGRTSAALRHHACAGSRRCRRRAARPRARCAPTPGAGLPSPPWSAPRTCAGDVCPRPGHVRCLPPEGPLLPRHHRVASGGGRTGRSVRPGAPLPGLTAPHEFCLSHELLAGRRAVLSAVVRSQTASQEGFRPRVAGRPRPPHSQPTWPAPEPHAPRPAIAHVHPPSICKPLTPDAGN